MRCNGSTAQARLFGGADEDEAVEDEAVQPHRGLHDVRHDARAARACESRVHRLR